MTATDPATAIMEQAHRELASLRDIDAQIRAYARLAEECVLAGSFLVGEKKRKLAEVAQLRQDATDIRAEERRIAKGWMNR